MLVKWTSGPEMNCKMFNENWSKNRVLHTRIIDVFDLNSQLRNPEETFEPVSSCNYRDIAREDVSNIVYILDDFFPRLIGLL